MIVLCLSGTNRRIIRRKRKFSINLYIPVSPFAMLDLLFIELLIALLNRTICSTSYAARVNAIYEIGKKKASRHRKVLMLFIEPISGSVMFIVLLFFARVERAGKQSPKWN